MGEFKWNKMPKMDYLYFLMARINAHWVSYYDAYPEVNCFYQCLKKNGDLNSIAIKVREDTKEDIFFAGKSLYKTMYQMLYLMGNDAVYGNVGKFVYVIASREKLFVLYKIKIKSFRYRKKVLSMLRKYRHEKIKSPANIRFIEELDKSIILDPTIIYEQSPEKKQKMYQSDRRNL